MLDFNIDGLFPSKKHLAPNSIQKIHQSEHCFERRKTIHQSVV